MRRLPMSIGRRGGLGGSFPGGSLLLPIKRGGRASMNQRGLGREVAGVVLLGAGAFALLALASYDPQDYAVRTFPHAAGVSNWGGATGAALAFFFVEWVGTIG